MVAESGRHPASKLLRGIPTLGAVRVAQLISVAATPHRFRYPPAVLVPTSGLAVQTRSSADYRFEGSELRRATKKTATRGLKRDHNRTLKGVFKGAASDGESDRAVQVFLRGVDRQRAAAGAGARDHRPQDRGAHPVGVEERRDV